MVKPSLPHHGPVSAGTMAPIVPPSQSMVVVISAQPIDNLQRNLCSFSFFVRRCIGAAKKGFPRRDSVNSQPSSRGEFGKIAS